MDTSLTFSTLLEKQALTSSSVQRAEENLSMSTEKREVELQSVSAFFFFSLLKT